MITLGKKGKLPVFEAVSVLSDIATALSDIHVKVVHRDIKPENILLLNGRWCISDFGILRYAEASTAVDTHKFSWTVAYNAPEKWQYHRATAASDMYSLGVIVFELITGERPLPGVDPRQEHLTQNPPPLTDCPPLLTALVAQCLMKAPQVRPLAKDFISRLGPILRPSSGGASLLQSANLAQS
ncbi:protein kinase domain-containing protein [Paenibacillus sp. AGC30]